MSAFLRQHLLKLYQLTTGRQMMAHFNELHHTQWLSRDELLALQQAKLQRLVEYAYRYVPYYRQTFDEIGFNPEELRRDPTSFQSIPTVTKEYVREHVDEFKTTDPTVRKTLHSHSTSGSTGEPLIFWEDTNYRASYTASFFWHLTWSGWKFGQSYALVWGSPNPGHNASLLSRLRNAVMDYAFNHFSTDALVLSEEKMAALASQIQRHKTQVLFGYASSLFEFARYVQEKGLDIKLDAVYTSAEILFAHQRQFIEVTFGCKVFDRYGALEVGRGLACECDAHTGLHINTAGCYLEIMGGNESIEDERPGEIVITNLNNYGFPLIRYRVKDVVQRLNKDCPCGRQSPMLGRIHGRTVDIFRTVDGEPIWGSFVYLEVPGVKQYQIVQKAVGLMLIRIVSDNRFGEVNLDNIARSIKNVMGEETEIRFEFTDHLPRTDAGKYRYAYSELPQFQPDIDPADYDYT